MVTTDDAGTNLATGDLDLNGEATDTSWAAGDTVVKLSKAFSDSTLDNLSTALAVGDVVYFFDASAVGNSGFYTVGTAAAATDDLTNGANELGLKGAADLSAVTYAATLDTVTKLTNVNALVGNTMSYQEVEPIITLASSSPSGSKSPSSDQVVAVYDVKAEGGRDMTFNSVTVEKSGSNSPEQYVTKMSLWNGGSKLSEVITSTVAGTADGSAGNADTTLVFNTDAGTDAGDIGGITAAEAATIKVGDKLTIYEATGPNTSTATVTSITGSLGANGVGDYTVTFDGTVTLDAAATAISIRNNRVHFDANQANTGDTALTEQTISSGSTMTLTVKADTSSVKSGAGTSTVTFGVSLPGSNGPLQVTSTQIEGLQWDYTPLGTGTATYRTEADAYPVTGSTLQY